jgi:cytochrome P450
MPDTVPDVPLRFPFDLGPLGTPPPVVHWARRHRPVCPVVFTDGFQAWLVTRRDDILRIFTDQSLVPSWPAIPAGVGDGKPEYVDRLVSSCFATDSVERYRTAIEKHVGHVLDRMSKGCNPADLWEEFSVPLASAVCCEIFGIPFERRRIHDLLVLEEPEGSARIRELATRVVTERISTGWIPDDPVGVLIGAREAEGFDIEEVASTVAFLIASCARSLVSALLTGPLTLLLHPKLTRECRRAPELWPGAVEELRRYHPGAVLGPLSVATRDIELHGTVIRSGEAVCAAPLGAAWDEEYYPTPAKFDIHRPAGTGPLFPRALLALGDDGVCRLVLALACPALFARFPLMRLAVDEYEIPWRNDLAFMRPACLPVAW